MRIEFRLIESNNRKYKTIQYAPTGDIERVANSAFRIPEPETETETETEPEPKK